MLQEKKSKRGAWIALGCVAALLVLVIVLENTMQPTSMLFTVLKKGAVYALVAASLNLLNGFTGLFSLGQAGFMLLGAYTYAILTIPSADRESVYYLYGGSAVNFSLPELFGGGEASLVLEDESDVLACGIGIRVAPPGKVIKNLEALSGGEQALVAISIYFAILAVNPAPFCILDEIEAALDDANVVRFAQYLRRVSDKTQFIVITHRRGTMEAANVLYGVTMQEDGVSKLLKLDLEQVDATLVS